MKEAILEIERMRSEVERILDKSHPASLQNCLKVCTKDDLKTLAKNNDYSFKTKWTKEEIVAALETEILTSFQIMLSRMTMIDLYTLISAINQNEQEMKKIGPFISLERAGYAFCATKRKDSEYFSFILPTEIMEQFLQWLTPENMQVLTERELMHVMITGMVNLYGVFPESLFQQIWAIHYPDQSMNMDHYKQLTTLKQHNYISYTLLDGYIMQNELVNQERWKEILEISKGKSYFIPSFQQLLYYADHPFDERGEHFINLRTALEQKLIMNPAKVDGLMNFIGQLSVVGAMPIEIIEAIKRAGVVFINDADLEKMFLLAVKFSNHTRKWINRGHQPIELAGGTEQKAKSHPKIGRNDACLCGSGKKYKKCCGRNRVSQS